MFIFIIVDSNIFILRFVDGNDSFCGGLSVFEEVVRFIMRWYIYASLDRINWLAYRTNGKQE